MSPVPCITGPSGAAGASLPARRELRRRPTPHRPEGSPPMPDADGLQDAARGVRHDIVADLPELVERFADQALDRGTHVSWASTAAEARDHLARVLVDRGATHVLVAGSPVTDEIDVNAMLAARGVGLVETDLGQWIARLADEVPDHVMGAARPQQRQRMHDLFMERAQARPFRHRPDELVQFGQQRRREQLLGAEVGVAGADLAVADTGSVVLVAHDGDGRLLTALPPVLVVVLGIDRLAASWDQADLLLAVQARSATGRRRPSATTVLTGPRADGDGADRWRGGPEELHVVVLDNGRSRLLAQPEPEPGAWLDPMPPGGGAALTGSIGPTSPTGSLVAEVRGERATWRLWATAWSDARRYSATTRSATWDRWVTRVAGHLPGAASWAPGGEAPDVPPDRFRDRWWKGQV